MTTKRSILLVEDERNISDIISAILSAQDYKVIPAYTAAEGISLAASQCPDLILLDLGLPDMDGMEVLKQLRTWIEVPILIVSARAQEKEKVDALDLGANDYITKPFANGELLARIRTALRHSVQASQSIYYAKGLSIDFEDNTVTKDGVPIHLTQVEFKIVSFLAKNSGKVITYDTLLSQIWGPYADDNNRILRVNMANIRRKIESNPADPIYIFTELGVGYRMADDEGAPPLS